MEHIPILRMGEYLLVSIQVDMCAPSTRQSEVPERPSPGTWNPAYGPRHSIPSASIHKTTRVEPNANPPVIQNAPDIACQQMMRRKLLKFS